MKFRYARHTNDLKAIVDFYTQVVGLKVIGSFQNHADYNGVFLGFQDLDWQLEFTASKEEVNHHPDEDDLLVFYVNSHEEQNAIKLDAEILGFPLVQPKNPYWKEHGIQINDTDQYGVIISVQNRNLTSADHTTQQLLGMGITTWNDLIHFVKGLPYGRNAERTNFDLVISDGYGTCSTKHALLKQLADSNKISGVKLIIGIYKMNETNTNIGDILSKNGLEYIPEAHCYLMINGKRIDATFSNSNIHHLQNDILEEIEIDPIQVGEYKVVHHKKYIQNWILENDIDMTFEEVWSIRERCIEELTIKKTP